MKIVRKSIYDKVFNVLLISILTLGWTCKEETKYSPVELTLVFTASVNGEVEPCGCKTDPSGGLARKAAYINKLRSEGNQTIILDSGDLFFQKEYLNDSTRNEMAAKASLIVDAFNEMSTTAINIGDDDFILGLDYLLSLRDRAQFPFISSNIYSAEYEKPIFEEYVIWNNNGIRVGLIGLAWDSGNYPEAVIVQDPYLSAKNVITKIQDKVDLIIAFTHMPLKVEIALADSLPEVELFIGGHDGKSMIKPKLANDHGMYKAGNGGESIGIIELKITDRRKKINEITAKLLNLKKVKINLARLEESLRGKTREKIYEDNKQDAAKLEELKAKKLRISEEIRSYSNTASFSLLRLSVKYPTDKQIESYVKNFRSHFPIAVNDNDVEEELLFE